MGYIKTTILMAAMTALFMGVGYLLGGSGGALIALIVAAAMNLFAWWGSAGMVLRMHNARPVPRRDPSGLSDMVADLSQRAGLPMPQVYIIEQAQPNAFATGAARRMPPWR